MTTNCASKALATAAVALVAATAAACGSGGSGGSGGSQSTKVAFLMPDQGSTRYEQHDRPGFKAKIEELCRDLQGALPERRRRRGQAAAAVQLGDHPGRQGHRARPGRLDRGRVAGQRRAGPGRQGHRLRPADPATPRSTSTCRSTTRRSARRSRQSLVQNLKSEPAPTGTGGLLQVNGSPTDAAARPDQEGHPRRARRAAATRSWLSTTRPNWAAAEGAAVGQRPDHPLRQQDHRRRRRQRRHRRRRDRRLQGGRRQSRTAGHRQRRDDRRRCS